MARLANAANSGRLSVFVGALLVAVSLVPNGAPSLSTTATFDGTATNFSLRFDGVAYDTPSSGQSTWTYTLMWDGSPHQLSHFVISGCFTGIVSASDGGAYGPDGNGPGHGAGFRGIKWEGILQGPEGVPASEQVSFVLAANYALTGEIQGHVQAGNGSEHDGHVTLPGPDCGGTVTATPTPEPCETATPIFTPSPRPSATPTLTPTLPATSTSTPEPSPSPTAPPTQTTVATPSVTSTPPTTTPPGLTPTPAPTSTPPLTAVPLATTGAATPSACASTATPVAGELPTRLPTTGERGPYRPYEEWPMWAGLVLIALGATLTLGSMRRRISQPANGNPDQG